MVCCNHRSFPCLDTGSGVPYPPLMRPSSRRKGQIKSRIRSEETFSDGSKIIELMDGSLIVEESSFANPQVLLQSPASYSQPAPNSKPLPPA